MTGFIHIIDDSEYKKAKSYFNGKNIQPDEYKDIYKDIFCKVVAEIAVSYRKHNASTLRYDLLKYDFLSKGINGRDLKNMVNAHQLAEGLIKNGKMNIVTEVNNGSSYLIDDGAMNVFYETCFNEMYTNVGGNNYEIKSNIPFQKDPLHYSSEELEEMAELPDIDGSGKVYSLH